MTPVRFLPSRLDVAVFAKAQAALDGTLPWAEMPRLSEATIAPADGGSAVSWQAQGLWRQPLGGSAEIRLRLLARATVWLTCQRCLEPVSETLEIDRTLRFVTGEDEAARLDEDSEEDVLALTRALDLPSLVEDELILALPLVPRHAVCPQRLPWPAAGDADAAPDRKEPEGAAHPFAVLKALKRR